MEEKQFIAVIIINKTDQPRIILGKAKLEFDFIENINIEFMEPQFMYCKEVIYDTDNLYDVSIRLNGTHRLLTTLV